MQTHQRSSILISDIYKIKPLPRETGEVFGVFRQEVLISTHLKVADAVLNLMEHFKDSRSAILERVRDPEITVNFFVR